MSHAVAQLVGMNLGCRQRVEFGDVHAIAAKIVVVRMPWRAQQVDDEQQQEYPAR